ncbi:MAG: ion transporter [Halobacteriota archaeon]
MSGKSIGRKQRIYDALGAPSSAVDPAAARGALLFYALLWIFVFVVIAGSYSSVYETHQSFFESFFSFAVAVLAIELVVRLWVCTVDPKFSGRIKGRLKYLFTTSLVINLLIIVPYIAKYFVPGTDVALNSIIVLVTLKLVTRAKTFSFVLDVLKAKRQELAVALAIDIILLITFSSFMFIVMHPVDPQGFSSIPASAWWAAQTLTTVGYGDLLPTTPLGQLLAIVAMFLGIATFAIPIAIVGAGFMEVFEARKGQHHASNDPIQLLRNLANLKEEGVITEAQFEAKQKEILERL